MKSMASIIDVQALYLKTARVSSRDVALFKDYCIGLAAAN
jgi:hypothetical protein